MKNYPHHLRMFFSSNCIILWASFRKMSISSRLQSQILPTSVWRAFNMIKIHLPNYQHRQIYRSGLNNPLTFVNAASYCVSTDGLHSSLVRILCNNIKLPRRRRASKFLCISLSKDSGKLEIAFNFIHSLVFLLSKNFMYWTKIARTIPLSFNPSPYRALYILPFDIQQCFLKVLWNRELDQASLGTKAQPYFVNCLALFWS